jgi:AraC-like DNA-binding protein
LNGAVDFTFVSRQPAGVLSRHVSSLWYARGQIPYRRERIAPTGSTVAGIVLGSPLLQTPDDGHGETFTAETGFLLGPHDRPIVNEPTAETHCVGIVTTPTGCRAAFGLAPAPIRGRIDDLLAAWPAASVLRERLLRLADAGADPSAILAKVESTLAAGLPTAVPGQARCERAVAALVAEPTRSIADVAATLGISHGHLDREFTRIVGLTPRVLARTLRMGALLERVDVYGQPAWTEHAAALGWYDQAHLIRDFVRHTGVTPSQYQAAQRAQFTRGEEAPGFVPDDAM